MALGPGGGPAFAAAALAALRTEAGGCVQGCEVMVGGYWLLNVMQLRWMLWALQEELAGHWRASLEVGGDYFSTIEPNNLIDVAVCAGCAHAFPYLPAYIFISSFMSSRPSLWQTRVDANAPYFCRTGTASPLA